MTIATQQDLTEWCGINGAAELIQLTDPANTAIDTALVTAKLKQADAEVYARLASANIPLTAPYPKLLINAACKLARYFLYTSGRPDYVKEDYQDAIKLLNDIRDGKATLGLDGNETAPADVSASDSVSFTSAENVFAREAGY